tara:strand:+ start:396 stop:845 length:450 start_codon:yes stop_codon:yes gene_type:complete
MGRKKAKKVESGNNISVHYKGTLDDGQQFDSSYDRGEPVTFSVGSGMMIAGFNNGVIGMKVGETKKVEISPQEAYGEHNPDGVQEVTKENFPNDFDFVTGKIIQGTVQNGQPFVATILEEKNDTVTLDFNHPMAGKNLNFEIELVSINE